MLPRQLLFFAATSALSGFVYAADQSNQSQVRADRAQQAVAYRADALARRIDNRFDDPTIEDEARSRLRVGGIIKFSDRDSTDFRTRFSGKLHLPSLSERISLTFSGNEEELNADEADTSDIIDEDDADAFDDPSFGLEYLLNDDRGLHTSFSVSTRLDNPSLNFGPRIRYRRQLNEQWRGRFTQRVLWDTNEGWETHTRLNFDRAFDSGYFFRQSLRTQWWASRRDDTGIRQTVSSEFIKPLAGEAALKYRLTSEFTTQPRSSWSEHRVSVHYRQNFWRDWVYLEIAPFVAFEDKFNWHPNLGIRLRLDMIFSQTTGQESVNGQ